MNLKVAQVLGLNTDQKAAQVISSIQDQENAFFALLYLASDDAFTKGRLALSELADFYFDQEGTPSEKLNVAYEEAKRKFAGLEFDLITAAISGKILYFKGQGQLEVFLKRDDKLSALFKSDTPLQLVSGFLEEGDRIFFATSNLVDFLRENLPEQLGIPLEAFEEEVTDKIGAATPEGNGLAGLLIEAEKAAENVVIEPLDEERKIEEEVESAPAFQPRSILGKIPVILGKIARYLPKSGRGKLILAVILLLLLTLGAGLKVKSARDKNREIQFSQTLQAAKDDLVSAKGLASLNPLEAKAKLDSAKDKVSKALSLKPGNQEAENLKKQIEQDSGSILKQSTVADFPIFLDMDLVKKNFRAQNFSLSSGKILLLDPTVKTLVVVDVAKKSHQILAGKEQLGEGAFASLNGDLAFVYSKDEQSSLAGKGILRVDIINQKVSVVAKLDDDWGAIADIYAFAGNIYALDSMKNMIWKYLPAADGYSDKREYLTKSTVVDFAGALRMQIESSVYVLKNGGEILRFTRGEKDNFGLEGLDKPVNNPKSFFVSSDTDNLYILDSGNSRVLVLTKTGGYKGQYSGEKFATAADLVVDEIGKKIYLLEGSKIYTVDLK